MGASAVEVHEDDKVSPTTSNTPGSSKSDIAKGTVQDIEGYAEPSGVNIEDTARVVDHVAERALCRKFDIRLMPVLAVMCQ